MSASHNIYDARGKRRASIVHKPAQQLVDYIRLRLTHIDLELHEDQPCKIIIDNLLCDITVKIQELREKENERD